MSHNTTGQAQPGDYLLGRGRLYIATRNNDGTPGPFRDVGNVPSMSLNITTENIEHQSSRQSTRVTDVDAVLSLKAEVSFETDELSFNNLADFLLGTTTAAAYTNPAIAGYSATVLTTSLELGKWYNLDDGSGNRPRDFAVGTMTVRRDPSGTPATLTNGTDYQVDTTNGMIFFYAGVGTALEGDTIDVAMTANAGANPNIHRVRALQGGVTAVALKFISLDGVDSTKNIEYEFHNVALKPDGELPLVGDDFATMGFTGTCAAEETAFPTSPYFSITESVA